MSNNIVQQFGAELRVSSEVIAERTENQHASVIRLVRDRQAEFEQFGQVGFEIRAGYNNAQVTTAQLNEPQATLLMAFLRNTPVVVAFKVKLVQEFYRMRQALTAPKSLEQRSLELIGDLNTEVLKLTAQVERDAPKVEYVDTYVADADLRLVRNVAKSIGMGEQELRNDLLERKWIYSESATRWSESKQEKETITRYSPYSHKAHYFVPVPSHEAPRFRGEVMHRLKVTPAGAVAVARLYGKHLSLVEEVAS